MSFVFRTVEDSIRDNGERFIAKAEKYFAEGNVKHAIGALKKAQKNFVKANELRDMKTNLFRDIARRSA